MIASLPNRITVTVFAGATPLAHAWVRITLHMSRKNDFNLLFGPSSARGQIEIVAADLYREADKVRNLFLMDYVGLDAAFTGQVRVAVLDHDAIERALAASEVWADARMYPADFASALRAFDEVLATLDDRPHVTVDVEPPKVVTVETD